MPPTFLIIEDQPTDQQILAEMLRNVAEEGTARTFHSPHTGLEWLQTHQPELILVDYRLPGMDGIAFLRACAEIPHCAGIPIIVITVVQDRDLRRQALEAGATDFLTKPLDLQECQTRCRNLLTLRQQQLRIAEDARRLAEARNRTQRALLTLTQSNKLLVEAGSEAELLEGMCWLVVGQGGYPLVWVNLMGESPEKPLLASAPAEGQNGVAEGIDLPEELWEEVLDRDGPRLIPDLVEEDRYRPWTEGLIRSGLQAALLLPIRVEGRPMGILGVYAEQAGPFDDEEVELLARLADNLGYGVAALRSERARDQAERDADFLVHYDPLTGLPNRTSLLKELPPLLEGQAAESMAVLVINLDRFKLVNDTSGHEAGDQLLLQVVERIRPRIRRGELLARGSGDEFLLVTAPGDWGEPEEKGAQGAAKIAEWIIQVLGQPFQVGDFEYYIGASVGISLPTPDQADVQELLSQADSAMRQAKASGGNTFAFYSGALTEHHTRRLALESQLHRGVREREFVLVYQPIVRLDTGEMVGAEALLRWPQEDGTWLGPQDFIEVAEETGLMVPLGGWVFQEACRQARAWADAGLDLYVSVNLSTHQLLSPSLVQDLQDPIEKAGVSPGGLELEVTEGAIMTDPPRTEGVLEDLHAYGLRIAVDDFGTGYSSLSRLKHLPISTLKIDKDFVLGLPHNANDRTIVRSIIQLAGNLGMRTVAEGVETANHRQGLMELGDHLVQGNYFSRPDLPERLVETHGSRGDL